MSIAVTEDPVSLENSYIIQFDSHNIKTELMRMINIILQEKSCTQTEIAKILGVNQPEVSHVKNLHTFSFSLSRLLLFILKLGYDIDLKINNLIPSPVSNETNEKELFLPITGELSKFITRPICLPNNEYWYYNNKSRFQHKIRALLKIL